ncbi:MAG: glycosyltransferase family 9 protein [Patescibacteria group bacterium]
MSKFYSGLKKFFNLKEDAQKQRATEIEVEPSQPAVEEKLVETEMKIKSQELSPAAIDIQGLSDDKKPIVAATLGRADSELVAAKQDSLGSLSEIKKLSFTAGVVDTSDILRSRAYRVASEQMTAEKGELKGFKGILKKIWKYNYAENYLHGKARVEIKKKMVESDNLYIGEKLSPSEQAAANADFQAATLSRFTSEIKEMVEENLGEKKEELKDSPETKKIKSDLKKIINDYADGRLDQAGFEGAKRTIFAAIEGSQDQTTIKKSEMYVDNFLAIAVQVKEIKDNIRLAADHQAKLAQFDFDINLVLGKAKEGVKTETHYNLAERTVERLRQTKLGSLVNETTLAAAVGLTYSAGSFVSQRVIRSKALAIGTLGLAAGVSGAYAGVKESQMQKRERQTLEARTAIQTLNIQVEKNRLASEITALESARQSSSNPKELQKIKKSIKALEQEQEKLESQEKFLYEKVTANELNANLDKALEKQLQSAPEVDALLDNLADIEARLELSNERKIDLISYSSLTSVEKERQKLLQSKWQAKQKLASLPAGIAQDWEKRLKDLTTLHRGALLDDEKGGIKQKDKEFNKHKNKEVFKKVTQNLIIGLTVGAAAQEGFALLSDKQEGLVENLIKGNDRAIGSRDTALETLKNFITGNASAGKLHEIAIDNGLIKMPANCNWLPNPDGSFNLVRGSEVLAEHLTVNPDGSLTEEAKGVLAAENIQANVSQYVIQPGETVTAATQTGPADYIAKHPESFKQVSRELWYANDTPMYMGEDGKLHGADLNELREQWGGDRGSGINLKTNSYEMTAFKMTPDGSFETVGGTKLSENAAELIKEGKMKFLFSLSDGTQDQVIEIPVDPATGKISVERESDLGRLLFGEKDGRAVLKARFSEVAVSAGLGKDGVEKVHVFATAVGEGLKEIDESVVTNVPPHMGTATALDIPRETDLPPFVPIGWRKPLEPVKKKTKPGVPPVPTLMPSSYYDRYYGGKQKEDYVDLNRYRASSGNANLLAARFGLTPESAQATKPDSESGVNIAEDNQDSDAEDNAKLKARGLNVTLDREDNSAILKNDAKSKRKGLRITLDREDAYNPGNQNKTDVIDLQGYKDKSSEEGKEAAAAEKRQKYSFIFDQLAVLQNYDQQSDKVKAKINKDWDHFNKQRHSGSPLSLNEYIGQQITRLYHQIDNVLMSEAKVGDKPFSPEFYQNAPLVKGLERAQEVVIILDTPIGDAVLTIPALLAVQKYLELNKMNKPIKLVTSPMGMDLFKCMKDQFPKDVELINYEEMGSAFANDKQEKFVINAHKDFKDYASLNLQDGDNKDLSRVMSVAWDSWTKEEVPKRAGFLEKYDAIPARIMRNFENMFGQKLFGDINKMDHYLGKNKDFDKVSTELKDKYKIKPDEQIVVISAGSSVQPKEYEPEKWEKVIDDTIQKYPKAHILFLQDPNPERWARYSPMINKITSQKSGRFDVVAEPTSRLNAMMSMADVTVTPDTGLGHYASALGRPNIMLILGDPVRWSNAKTDRIMHKKARETYAKNAGTYSIAWTADAGYYVNDRGEMIGSSNLDPALINQSLEKYLKK